MEIKTYKPIDGQKEFAGILKAYDADTITIGDAGSDAENDNITHVFKRAEVALIRLALDF